MGREVARQLIEAGAGEAIVNLSSIAALAGSRHEPDGHYASSKAAIRALTRQMAVEWGPSGIRANAVCPGVVRTPMLRITDDPKSPPASWPSRSRSAASAPAEDVASLVCFLLSDAAGYITGAMVPVDGGVTAL